jgi:hypothetical protein
MMGLWLAICTRWFKYDRDDLCVNKSQFVPVIFEPPCIFKDFVTLLLIFHMLLYLVSDTHLACHYCGIFVSQYSISHDTF